VAPQNDLHPISRNGDAHLRAKYMTDMRTMQQPAARLMLDTPAARQISHGRSALATMV
jgi:hypothetical protein